MDEMLAELVARLNSLNILAQPTIALIEETFRELGSVAELEYYNAHIMPVLEKCREFTAQSRHIQAFMDRMAELTDPSTLLAEFSLKEFGMMEWLGASVREAEMPRKAYCTANGLACFIPELDASKQSPTTRAVRTFLQAHFLHSFFDENESSAALLENSLDLAPERYHQPGLRLHLDQQFDGVCRDTAVRTIYCLAESLYALKRYDDVRRVLEAFFEIDAGLYGDRDALAGHLDWWLDRCRESIDAFCESLSDEERAEKPIQVEGPLSFCGPASKMVAKLAWTYHQFKESERAVTLFGAFFELWPDSLSSLDKLRRRMEVLGDDGAFELLGNYTSLIKWAGQLETFHETFRHEFAAGTDAQPPGPSHDCWRNEYASASALLCRCLISRLSEQPNDVIALYFGCAGIREESLENPDAYPRRWLTAVEPVQADPLVFVIAQAFVETGQMSRLVSLMETEFAVSGEEYFATEFLRRHLLGRWEDLPVNRGWPLMLLFGWSFGLVSTDRVLEAAGLLAAIYPELTEDAADYRPFFRDIEELPEGLGEVAVWTVARILSFASLDQECINLIQEYLGIESGCDYRFKDRLSIALETHNAGRLQKYINQIIFILGQSLHAKGRPHDAVVLVEARLGLMEVGYYDRQALWARFRELDPFARSAFGGFLAAALVSAGNSHNAVSALEALLELNRLEDYSVAGWLSEVGRRAFADLEDRFVMPLMVELVWALLTALEADGKWDKYHRLLETLDRDDDWLDPKFDLSFLSTVFIAEHMVGHLQERQPDRCLQVCTKAVELLRSRANQNVLSALDRWRLVSLTASFRRRLITVGHTLCASEPDPERAETLRRRFLCWDAELGQRLVVERFLFATPGQGWDGAEEPVPGWACQRGRFLDVWPATNAGAPSCFERRPDPTPAPAERPHVSPFAVLTTETQEFAESLRHGVEEQRLAEVLGDHQLLLRAGFTQSGQLVWSLFGRVGDQIQTRCHGQTASGRDVRAEITTAVRRHDDAVRETWERLRLAQAWVTLLPHAERLGKLVAADDWTAVSRLAQRLDARLQEHHLASVRKRLWERFPWQEPDVAASTATDAGAWRQFWDALAGERVDAQGLSDALDRATAAFLEDVAASWPQDDLAAALDAAPDMNVLIQLDEVLHSVPVAFLKHQGRYLFERARSMHSVLSLALVDQLGVADVRALQETLDLPDKILSLSWFEPGDLGARLGAERLHEGHRAIPDFVDDDGLPSGVEWYSAADLPRGTHACLARGLALHGVFRVASVCGHGRGDLAGIELADGVWNGSSLLRREGDVWRTRDACDLMGIELLVQVSCSIGRVRQTELQDVEGFCVELAVHRARSVLAGLWPLHSVHSPEFANRVVAHYLRLRNNAVREAAAAFDRLSVGMPKLADDDNLRSCMIATHLSSACLRARALAEARAEWLASVQAGRPAIGLNTAAAFELYGLG